MQTHTRMAGVSFGDEPRPAHRLVVTATVRVDVAPDEIVAGQLLDVSLLGAYFSVHTTSALGGLVRFAFGTAGEHARCIAYGRVARTVAQRDSTGIEVRFNQHNAPFATWIDRVRDASPTTQVEAVESMLEPVLRLR